MDTQFYQPNPVIPQAWTPFLSPFSRRRDPLFFVVPAQAGTQFFFAAESSRRREQTIAMTEPTAERDSRLRGNDD